MSLINKGLRDLDNRLPAINDSKDVSLSSDIRVVKQTRRFFSSHLFFFFLMLCLAGFFAWLIGTYLTINDNSRIDPLLKAESSVIQPIDIDKAQQPIAPLLSETTTVDQKLPKSETVQQALQGAQVEDVSSVTPSTDTPQFIENPVEVALQNETKLSTPLQLEQEGM